MGPISRKMNSALIPRNMLMGKRKLKVKMKMKMNLGLKQTPEMYKKKASAGMTQLTNMQNTGPVHEHV